VHHQAALGDAFAAQAAGHLHSLEHARGSRRRADRTRLADVVRPVALRAAVKTVSLDRAGKALAVGDAADLDLLAGLEHLDRHVLADDELALAAKLDEAAVRAVDVVLLQVPELALRHLSLCDLVIRELDRVVAVRFSGLHLHHRTRRGLDHRHRSDDAGLRIEDPRHAELSADDDFHSLMSMSTPAGRSSRMSESTVFGVGEWMSISRLCVRTSKCSRESLSLNGERITQ